MIRDKLNKFLPNLRPDPDGDSFFLRLLKKWRKEHPGVNVVISDIRFPDELKAVHRMDGYVIKVVRPGLEGSGVGDHHISEQGVAGDVEVQNDDTKEAFCEEIGLLVRNWVRTTG